MSKITTFDNAKLEAIKELMKEDKRVFLLGLGVGVESFQCVKEQFPNRVYDTPISEAAITGAAIGAALTGMCPIINHNRVEFALYAADQIVTQAAKWNYMFGGNCKVPIVFLIVVGRQWGNGPQHAQGLYSLFGSTPGLRVVAPSTPSAAKALMKSAIRSNSPVVYLESLWLRRIKEDIIEDIEMSLDESRYLRRGSDITIVSYSDGIIECLKAAKFIKEKYNIECEIIDLVSLNPLDMSKVYDSCSRTGKILCVDIDNSLYSVGNAVISQVMQHKRLSCLPKLVSAPSVPCPTSAPLAAKFYPNKIDVINAVISFFEHEPYIEELSFEQLHYQPQDLI
jgi:pyruvate/2-oxoglutarate/acetoin dehydrogenase E1 component